MTLASSSAAGPSEVRIGGSPTQLVTPVRLGPAAAGRCRRRVHLDADPNADTSHRAAADDGLRLRLADGEAHRIAVLRAFSVLFGVPNALPWDPAGPLRPAVVFEPRLRSASRFGTPDLLLWINDGYCPVIIRAHRTTDPGSGAVISQLDHPTDCALWPTRKPRAHAADALALAHHYRLLADLGLAASAAKGGVIGSGQLPGVHAEASDGEIVLWHLLDAPESCVLADYDRRYADRLLVASAAATGAPALAQPSRIGECRRCSWWPVCSAELQATKDISLIFAGTDVELLHDAGVLTVDDLAQLDPRVVAALPLTGAAPGTARIRARAWLGGWPLVRKDAVVRVRRADLELDVDMESFMEDGAYLWGTYLTGPAVAALGLEAGYRSFVSWNPLPDPDEGRAFAQFWAYLTELRALARANGLTFAAYCYSRAAEERWLRSTPLRYPTVPGMPSTRDIADFCASSEWVDIYQEIRNQFIVPGSMKLKALAPIAGFSWRDPEPGGENSMAWYRAAVGPRGQVRDAGPIAPLDGAMAQRILRYNEDDVLATLALRRWMTDCATQVPIAADLDADPGTPITSRLEEL